MDGRHSLAALLIAVACAACSDDGSEPALADADADASTPVPQGGAGAAAGRGGAASDASAPRAGSAARDGAPALDAAVTDAGAIDASTPPFTRPDGGADYTPVPGTCGFDEPAFCDPFELGPRVAVRAGELGERWSGARGGPWDHPNLDQAFGIGPALLRACRSDLPATVLPDRDALICDPIEGVPTRHALITAAAQNYGLTAYRVRQPFDFAGRTGTIKLDAELVNNGLGGWPAVVIAEDPSPAPSFDWEERGSGPRNGVEIEFSSGWCNTKNTLEVALFTFRDYVQTAQRPSFDCETPHTTTAQDRLNHVEIYLARDKLEVWASEPSPDGRTFPNFQRLLVAELDLPFTRGYVSLIVRNHATMKYWAGSAASTRFDNVGFDGPVVRDSREYSAPDSLGATHGLDGCMVGGTCEWRGDVIADHPGDDTPCHPEMNCTFDGEGRNVGYVVPNPDETPVRIAIPAVDLAGATRARLALAATYPWFDWNGVSMPPTAMNLRYRLNGGAWHDRFVSAIEANAFTDFSPDLGGAGHGAGLLNQIIELDLAELRSGDNEIELQGAGTWTGQYRIGVLGIDLIVTTAP